MPKDKTGAFKMRIRLYAGDRMLGPGKMELLAHVDETGSLAASAKQMGMSYMRAWKLVQELNKDPGRPMIEVFRGGAGGGASKLTSFGKGVLRLYQAMELAATEAASAYAGKLAKLLEIKRADKRRAVISTSTGREFFLQRIRGELEFPLFTSRTTHASSPRSATKSSCWRAAASLSAALRLTC